MQDPARRLDVEQPADAEDLGQDDVRDALASSVRDQQRYRRNDCMKCTLQPPSFPRAREVDGPGIGTLNLHLMSNTSSKKPRKVAVRRLSRLAR